jgi:hypothetical protein
MKYAILSLALLMATAWAQMSTAHAVAAHEFRGEIADSSCALNVHSLSQSHKEMLKAKYMGTTGADCARYCVHSLGANYVLVSNKDVHRLDQQSLVEKFAGEKVVVRGTLDKQSNTISVSSIH